MGLQSAAVCAGVFGIAYDLRYLSSICCKAEAGTTCTWQALRATVGHSCQLGIWLRCGAVPPAGTSETCNQRTHICADEFTGNTMGQAGLDGELMFLHSNMHKWDMRLPERFSLHYQRRWMKMLPGKRV